MSFDSGRNLYLYLSCYSGLAVTFVTLVTLILFWMIDWFVRPSHPFYHTYQSRKQYILKTNEPILLQIGQLVNGARTWNDHLLGSEGQKSRSHDAKVRLRDLAEVDGYGHAPCLLWSKPMTTASSFLPTVSVCWDYECQWKWTVNVSEKVISNLTAYSTPTSYFQPRQQSTWLNCRDSGCHRRCSG